MNKATGIFLCLMVFILLLGVNTTPGLANSAEPPSIVIIVPNAPPDLVIKVGPNTARRTDKVIESYFSIYAFNLNQADYRLLITTAGRTSEIKVDMPAQKYNNIFTLDLSQMTLTPGKSLARSFKLISLRVGLTLLIEGLVFYLFGYRKKRSWLIFLIVNLLTQGALNIWLNSFMPSDSYVILSLIFVELLVLFAELIVFSSLVIEHRRWRTALYVITANLLSLIAGGYLITALPI
jgi:hypothetical protein